MPANKKMPKNADLFCCNICDFKCSKQSNFEIHLSTDKHKRLISTNEKMPKNAEICLTSYCCDLCGKNYKHMSSLCKHKKSCKSMSSENNEVIGEKDDLIRCLIKENQEFKSLILEVCKNFQGNNISNINSHNINSNNKTFNLQIFLNETCKDAMNINEFIESMDIQLSDFESVGKLGFVDGISNIIIKNLKALDVEKRPIHCSDTKRETMYIKDDDKWEKEDDDRQRLKRVIKGVQDKNIRMMPKWKELYPDCILSNSKHTDKFNNMCFEIMGGDCGINNFASKNEKIIKKIAKEVAIEKYE